MVLDKLAPKETTENLGEKLGVRGRLTKARLREKLVGTAFQWSVLHLKYEATSRADYALV